MLACIRRSPEECLEVGGDGEGVPGTVRGSVGLVVGLLDPGVHAMMALDLERGSVWRLMIICGDDVLTYYIPCCKSREVRIGSISCDGAWLGEEVLSRS